MTDLARKLLRRIVSGDSPLYEKDCASELNELVSADLIAPQPGVKHAWMATKKGGEEAGR